MMSNIRLDKVPGQILYATLATNERGMIFVNFDYLFLQKIPIPILIKFLLRNLETSLTLISFHNVS